MRRIRGHVLLYQQFKFHGGALVLLAAVWGVVTAALWMTYWPMCSGDTGSYTWLIRLGIHYDLTSVVGNRTPGYPLLLLVCWWVSGRAEIPTIGSTQVIAGAQVAMGLTIGLMLYAIVWRATRRRSMALAAGLVQLASLRFAQCEMQVLSETLTAFFVTAGFAWLVMLRGAPRAALWTWGMLGVLVGGAAITRPNNIFLIPLIGALVCTRFFSLTEWRVRAARAGIFVALAVLPMFPWVIFLYARFGHLEISTLTGAHLTNQTIDFVAYAPAEYAHLRRLLVPLQLGLITARTDALGKVPLDSRIWAAFPAMLKLPEYAAVPADQRPSVVARDLLRMDGRLITEHRDLYAGAVAASCARFWTPGVFAKVPVGEIQEPRNAENGSVVRWAGMQDRLYQLSTLQPLYENPVYVAFVLLGLRFLLPRRLAPDARNDGVVMLGFTILVLATFSCAWVEYGNGRFILPYQPLVIAVAAVGLVDLMERPRGRRASDLDSAVSHG